MTNYPKLFEPKNPTLTLDLTPRQLKILYYVGDYKYIDTGLCVALLKADVDPSFMQERLKRTDNVTGQIIARELRLLFDYGYLARPTIQVTLRRAESGSHYMIYMLTAKGKKVLSSRSTKKFIAYRKDAQVPYIMHTLGIGKFRATTTLATKNHPDMELLFWSQNSSAKKEDVDKTLRTPVILGQGYSREKAVLIPDGFFGLKIPSRPEQNNRTYFFLEYDRGTMSIKDFKRKLLMYQRIYDTKTHTTRFNINGFRVLTPTMSERRRDNLRAMASEFPLKSAFYFTCESHYDLSLPESILGNIWVTGKHEKLVSIP